MSLYPAYSLQVELRRETESEVAQFDSVQAGYSLSKKKGTSVIDHAGAVE